MEKCVRYCPTEDDMRKALGLSNISTATKERLLASDHWEIWYGLPDEYTFEPTKTRDNSATFYAEVYKEVNKVQDGADDNKKTGDRSQKSRIRTHYIWLDLGVMQMVEENNHVLLLALGWRTKDKIHFTVISGRGMTLPGATDHVRKLNTEIFQRIYGEIKREARKEPVKKDTE